MTAFYNEIDPYAAQWLRNLIAAGHIAPGVVDERSIEDISPDELSEFTQCHFFAGVGVWSLALRRAGWPDDRPVWTGSCPCQPFSSAGQGAGFTDARHLWPSFAWLIANAKPTVVFGEQVASKAVGPWVDLVHADLETLGYAFGAVPFPSAGVGAPHIRDRLYWVGHLADAESIGRPRDRRAETWQSSGGVDERSSVNGLADPSSSGRREECENSRGQPAGSSTQGRGPGSEYGRCDLRLADPQGDGYKRAGQLSQSPGRDGASHSESIGGLADADHNCEGPTRYLPRAGDFSRGCGTSCGLADPDNQRLNGFDPLLQWEESRRIAGTSLETGGRGAVNGFWRGADWLGCRDDRFRPVEPGTFPLVARPTAGVGSVQPGLSRLYGRNKTGRLKAYGNAINAEAAHEFIAAYLDGLTHSS